MQSLLQLGTMNGLRRVTRLSCKLRGLSHKQRAVVQCLGGLNLSRSAASSTGQSVMSYEHGNCSVPLLGVTIGQRLEEAARTHGSGEAVVSVHQNIRYSHEELLKQCDRLAAGLMALGLRKGDRVGIWAPNCMEWVLVEYATARAGLVLVNVNPAYRISELEYAMRKVGVKAIIAAETFKTSNYYEMLNEMIPGLAKSDPGRIKMDSIPELQNIVMISDVSFPGAFRLKDVVDMGSNQLMGDVMDLQDKIQFDDMYSIQFTSGTTGSPKGVTLSHHNILNNMYFIGNILQYNNTSRICVPVPLYHCLGMVAGSLAPVTHGSTLVLPSESVNATATLHAVQQERCTSLYGTPTMFIDVLEHPKIDSYDVTSLTTGIMAGAPCPIEIMKQLPEKLYMRDVTICYGTTENSPVTFQSPVDAPLEKRVSTVGIVHPHTEAKIIDADGQVVPRGDTGELCIRGYCVMHGYWDDQTKTEEVIGKDRWYKTGDLSVMDEEGYVNIVGRSKDMIIRGGENIYPTEVEQFLYTHPKISDVQIFGVYDRRLGEEVCAWVKLKDGQTATDEEIKEFCREKIAHVKIPRYVHIVTEFPMTVTGKIQKFAMRQTTEENMKRKG